MTSRPAAIRLDDLAEPRFSANARELLDGMAALGAAAGLDADAILADAREQTGLDELGADDAFFERVGVYLDALDREAGLSDAGRLVARTQVTQLLTNRLLAHDYVTRHPDVVDVPITAPIVIVGLPRTGTTHLHNLMAADAALRSLPYWESLEPVPPRTEQSDASGSASVLDGRRDRCAAGLWFIDEVMPEFHRMHEMTVDHVHEEIQLLAIDCSTMLFESTAWVPSWRDYYRTHDQRPSYAYLRRMLQICQHQRGGSRRWVLKSPQHLEQIPAVIGTFPDATIVFTHRDPVAVIASFATMAAYSARTNRAAPIDVAAIAHYWRDRILDLYAACVRDRDLVPPAQAIDVHFDEFMADDVAMVERIYQVADLPFSGATRAAMDAFMADHPRGKFGGVLYDLDQLGLDAADIRAAAGPYVERFAVPLEARW
jgi:hypothetical protein